MTSLEYVQGKLKVDEFEFACKNRPPVAGRLCVTRSYTANIRCLIENKKACVQWIQYTRTSWDYEQVQRMDSLLEVQEVTEREILSSQERILRES